MPGRVASRGLPNPRSITRKRDGPHRNRHLQPDLERADSSQKALCGKGISLDADVETAVLTISSMCACLLQHFGLMCALMRVDSRSARSWICSKRPDIRVCDRPFHSMPVRVESTCVMVSPSPGACYSLLHFRRRGLGDETGAVGYKIVQNRPYFEGIGLPAMVCATIYFCSIESLGGCRNVSYSILGSDLVASPGWSTTR